ncbi:hypothetical protein IKQ21_03940 [bacterium]|nr:hypothetical protein [bacterium]
MGDFDIDTNFNLNYTEWENAKARKLAKKSDKDKIEGLNTVEEILNFFKKAEKNKIDVNEIFGLELSEKVRKAASAGQTSNIDYTEFVNYFNSLDDNKKSDITYRANSIGQDILYQLEKDVNQAFENCEGYQLIKLKRDRFEDKVRFNLEEVQNDVTVALNSINELQKDIEKAYDKAKGLEGTKSEYTDYDAQLKQIAQEKLGMSYEEFIEKYKDVLDITESITESQALDPDYENAEFYERARAYVKEIKKLARDTLQDTRTNSGERLLEETVKYSNSTVELIDFECEDINSGSIANMSSDIMRRAFLEAIDEERSKTDIKTPESENTEKTNKNKKVYNRETGKIEIITPEGIYNINGTKQK